MNLEGPLGENFQHIKLASAKLLPHDYRPQPMNVERETILYHHHQRETMNVKNK